MNSFKFLSYFIGGFGSMPPLTDKAMHGFSGYVGTDGKTHIGMTSLVGTASKDGETSLVF
jgi:hypothetical protein